jgi:hypothetical protein
LSERRIQKLFFFPYFKLSSSRPKIRIIIPYGVNKKKNINPKIIGETIFPRIIPKRIHNLFKGNNKFGLNILIERKRKKTKANKNRISLLALIEYKYTQEIKKTKQKKYPNFLLDGSFNFVFFIISIKNILNKLILKS